MALGRDGGRFGKLGVADGNSARLGDRIDAQHHCLVAGATTHDLLAIMPAHAQDKTKLKFLRLSQPPRSGTRPSSFSRAEFSPGRCAKSRHLADSGPCFALCGTLGKAASQVHFIRDRIRAGQLTDITLRQNARALELSVSHTEITIRRGKRVYARISENTTFAPPLTAS